MSTNQFKSAWSWYLAFLILFLIFNEIFDTYTTLFWSTIGSFVISEFQASAADYAFAVALSSVGMYFVFLNQAIADRIGRKPMLFIVLFGMGLMSLLLGLSSNLVEYSAFLFFLFVWFSSDIWVITISEEAPEKYRAIIVNLILVAGASVTLLIPILRSLLVPAYTWRAMTWFAALAIPLSFLALFLRETRSYRIFKLAKQDDLKLPSSSPWISQLLSPFQAPYHKISLAIIGMSFLTGMNYTFLTLGETYLMSDRGFPLDFVSFVIFLMGIASIISYALCGVIADLLGRKSTISLLVCIFPIGVILVLSSSEIGVLIGAMLLSGAFWSLNVIGRLICLEHYPTNFRGTGNGYRSLFYAFGITTGSAFTGLLIPIIGLGYCFLVLGLLLLLIIPVVYFILHETKGTNLAETFDNSC